MRKPRPFYHSPIYSSERRDRLAQVEQNAHQELGIDPKPAFRSEDIRGLFASVQKHRRGVGWLWSIPMLLSLIIIMVATLFIILVH